jgi:DNA-binding winged helix-turn-helix (wHTH) protein/tetratricopeptide (TPR) repeat protein
MAADRQFALGPFRFDARTGDLRGNGTEARLTPRAAAVLAMLAGRAEVVVTRQELFDQVWGGLAVSDDALTSCIQELRGALGDDARHPQYIETRHRRGYRLMLPATEIAPNVGRSSGLAVAGSSPLIGRADEMEELRRRFARALLGQRQIVFVTGEPGIGKSALAEAFVQTLDCSKTRIARGQCLDQHGAGEPYMPLIEAFTRLATVPGGGVIKSILATYAPSWLAQMPSLWTRSERAKLELRGQATQERMLRELTQASEEIAAETPLMLQLEDIHWSDPSTLDWLAHVARRSEPARLMVLATFRPANSVAITSGLGGIVSELALHGRCHEIALRPLMVDAIEVYLSGRLGGGDGRPRELARVLLERTGGNPLFMVSLVNQLVQHDADGTTSGAIGAIPHDVRRFIERQIDELDDGDRNLLIVASVIRREFATAAVAAALGTDIEPVETACARLARQAAFIAKSGSTAWPDGTLAELYAFRHDLYRELLYERLSATRRARIHARVGAYLEAAWATRPEAIAAEIAEHFERGNEFVRAIPHHQRAAGKALRRSANQEAIFHLQRALDAIGHIADDAERTKVEIQLLVAMGAAFMAMRGFGAPEVHEAYARAEALCDRLGERADLFPAIWGQWMFRTGRSEMEHSRRLGARLIGLGEKFGDATLKLQAHHAMWSTSFACGELKEACRHADAGIALYVGRLHQVTASSYGNHDAECCARNFSAMALALLGDERSSRDRIDQSLAAAQKLDDPFSLALTLYFTSAAAQMFGDLTLAAGNSQLGLDIANEHGLALPRAWNMGIVGWCAAESGRFQDGIALLTDAIVAMRSIQSRHFMSYLIGLLAHAQFKACRYAEAMRTVADGLALTEATGEYFYTAELHRLQGEISHHPSVGRSQDAKISFKVAIAIAQQQGALTLERRARQSLGNLVRSCT